MSGKIELTKELMTAARDYVPLEEKEAWVAENAPRCFDKLAISADDEPLPPMYMVNAGLKSRYLMAALVRLYFGQKIEQEREDDEWLMTAADYDRWAGSHIFNQLERMKRDGDNRTKAFDIAADYKDLEKRFSTQLSGLLAVQNDFVIRQSEMSSAMAKELPTILAQLNALQAKEGKADDDGE